MSCLVVVAEMAGTRVACFANSPRFVSFRGKTKLIGVVRAVGQTGPLMPNPNTAMERPTATAMSASATAIGA